ncbi:MAG TPA: tRNA preQ1(34) S-adenosylmethionine ribosyltransferase-isomerase QueA [Candidatus Rubrimentiphilum sp.]|nr:tRNA preQ1(34) S-adenosylmethionine ribosyltransferase-isomerase QueA [Candidatus Rubrimentiphilum sp.]
MFNRSPGTDSAFASAYDYDLPKELIAQRPAHPRDSSRLLAVRGETIEHLHFTDFPSRLRAGDLLVLNETRVIPARVHGRRIPSGGEVELLFLRPAAEAHYDPRSSRWLVLAKPGRRLRAGERIGLGEFGEAIVVDVRRDGVREIELRLTVGFEEFLARAGKLPLPPYVTEDSQQAQAGYQTIFARDPGSVAAPTASLHFTQEVFDELKRRRVEIAKLSLDVGLGTFRPLQSERIEEHTMHAEFFSIPQETARAVTRAKEEGRRIVAAGTTVVRALESSACNSGRVRSGSGETDLFIKPGFHFQIVDALLTNFHLPRSTLLMLVCAFAGRERTFRAYREAVENRYRFFSFGDAMFIESRGSTTSDAASV